VLCRWDVTGKTVWSLVEDVHALAAHFTVKLRDAGTDVWYPDGAGAVEDGSPTAKFFEDLFNREQDT
jgi:hypothetical protein